MRPKQQDFLKKYNCSDNDFKSTGLDWDRLMEIYDDFVAKSITFLPTAKDIVERLLTLKTVHSVRYRIKEPEHLIEKIIRKKLEFPDKIITIANYVNQIDDIIGVRALHLYKSDWEEIGDFISKTWDSKENPTANMREGDSSEIQKLYEGKGCKIKIHKYGYRSIHYIVESNPIKAKFTTEIQVRTIFEEGWSEIDHDMRYPYDLENPILKEYLGIFNRLSGSADEMGTFIKNLQKELSEIEKEHTKSLKERDKTIKDLKLKVEKLTGDSSLKEAIKKGIDKIYINEMEAKIDLRNLTDSEHIHLSHRFHYPPIDSLIESTKKAISFIELTHPEVMTGQVPITISTGIINNKCSECGTFGLDYPVTSNSNFKYGNKVKKCPSCNRYLCEKCWTKNYLINLSTADILSQTPRVKRVSKPNSSLCYRCEKEV